MTQVNFHNFQQLPKKFEIFIDCVEIYYRMPKTFNFRISVCVFTGTIKVEYMITNIKCKI